MARLPLIRRISREDIQEAPNWIERLLFPLNQFMETVYQALNKDLTFSENIRSQTAEVTFETSAAYDGTVANFTTVQLQRSLPARAQGILLLQIAENASSPSPIDGPVYVDWLDNNGVISINHVSGLNASTSYVMRLLII